MNSCGKIINAVPPFLQPLPPPQNTACNICASQQLSCKTPFPTLHRTTVRWTSPHVKGKTYKMLQKMSCAMTKSQMLSFAMREDRKELGLGRPWLWCSVDGRLGGEGAKGVVRKQLLVQKPFFQGRFLNLQAFGLAQNYFDNHQRKGWGHLRLLSVSSRGNIQNNKQNSTDTIQSRRSQTLGTALLVCRACISDLASSSMLSLPSRA